MTLVIVLVGYPVSFVALVALDWYVIKVPEYLVPPLEVIFAPCIWLVKLLTGH